MAADGANGRFPVFQFLTGGEKVRFWAGLAMAMAGLTLGWYVLFAGQLGRQTPSSRWVAEVRAIKLARAE
ncbi:hypothetical protein LRN66_15190, partial [Staphylococcus aureus]|nr:hypothetical protein [Staphylococcus aureus]